MSIEKYPIQNTGNIPPRSRKGWSVPLRNIPIMIAAIFFPIKFSLAVSEQAGGCSCSPLIYRWNLNFTNPCSSANVAVGPDNGIDDLYCVVDVDTLTNITADSSIPVMISSVLILERDEGGRLGSFVMNPDTSIIDGNVIEFESATKNNPSFISTNFVAEITGLNDAQEIVTLSIQFNFTNICGEPPFLVGDSIGWLSYVSNRIILHSKATELCTPSFFTMFIGF